MSPTLYFLRSSEQKITTDMLPFAYRLDTLGQKLEAFPELDIYHKRYGLSSRDLGLYALSAQSIVGAIWLRLLYKESGAKAFIDERTAVLTMAVKPEFRAQGFGSAMMEQLLLEAAALFEQISVSVVHDSKAVGFYEKFGFLKLEGSETLSPVDGSKVITMVKKLIRQEVQRQSDGYDASKWMD